MVLIGGWADWTSLSDIAKAYKLAGDDIVEKAYDTLEFAHEYTYPVIFLYRHAVELILKSIHPQFKKKHTLESLRDYLVQELKGKVAQSFIDKVRDRINDFNLIDKRSTRFRYGDGDPESEFLVHLPHLRSVVNDLFVIIEELAKHKAQEALLK
ncbi:MAG: hypothetical protein RIA62_17345 [Cyclobacteriaceae bacterium]